MKTKKVILLFIFFISIYANAQKSLPNVKVKDSNGNYFYLKDVVSNNSIVLLISGEDWCTPCRTALKYLDDRYGSNKAVFPVIYSSPRSKVNVKSIIESTHFDVYLGNYLDINKFNKDKSVPFFILLNNKLIVSTEFGTIIDGDSVFANASIDDIISGIKNSIKSIELENEVLRNKLNHSRDLKIQELIHNIKPKDEFEKKQAYIERYNKEKSRIEKDNSLDNYLNNYFFKNFELKIISTEYDNDNSILKIKLKDAEPIYVKNFPSSANVDDSNVSLYNLDISLISEHKFKINGGILMFNGRKYPISSTENSFLDNSEKEQIANSFLRKEQNRVFVPKIEYANISNLNNTLVFNGKNFMKEYKSRKNKSIENWKRKKNVTITSSEKLADYSNRISLNYVDEYDYDLIYDILKDFYPDFDFLKFTKKQYDAENEFFTIYYGNYGKIILPVPIDEAKSFSKALDDKNVKIKKIRFKFIDNNSIALTKIEFVYNGNYYYNKLKNKE